MQNSETEKKESCVDGLTRKEFLRKIVEKAVAAGTLAAIINTQISVHPSVAQLPSVTQA